MYNRVVDRFSRNVTVDYSKSSEEMVAAGKYDNMNRVYIPYFPIRGTGIVKAVVELLSFAPAPRTDLILPDLEELHLVPAPIEYILAIGSQYPDLQQRYDIAALGSVYIDDDGYTFIPLLTYGFLGRGRELTINSHNGWSPYGTNSAVLFAALPMNK